MENQILAGIILATILIHATGKQSMADESTFDITKIGPQVGATAPDFALPDQAGREHTLKSLMGPNGLVLVFFRSADW